MNSDKATRKTGLPGRLVMMMFFAFALLFLVVGAMQLLESYRFAGNSVAVTGTVVSVTQNTSGDGVTYRPVVRYLDRDGLKQQGTTALASSGYDFPVGSRLNILYDRRDPSNIRLDSWFALWGFSLIFVVVGIVPMVILRLVRRRLLGRPAALRAVKGTNDQTTSETGQVRRSDGDGGYVPTVRRNR